MYHIYGWDQHHSAVLPGRDMGGGGSGGQRATVTSEQRSSCSGRSPFAALYVCSSSRGTAHATNFGSLAPTHDFSEPQEVARIFHQAFSSTSTRTVISPPLLLSSGSHPNRLFTRMYTVHRDCIIDPRSQQTNATHKINQAAQFIRKCQKYSRIKQAPECILKKVQITQRSNRLRSVLKGTNNTKHRTEGKVGG